MTPQLLVLRPDGTSQRFPLSGERVRVGRSTQDNELSFPEDGSLSRWHLVFAREGDAWFVEDLKPKNPTLVNGSRLAGRHRLRSGDRLSAGKIVFLVEGGPVATESSSGAVVFVPGEEESAPLSATVMTRLDGILSGEVTRPGTRSGPTLPSRRLPIENPAVAAIVRACQELPGQRPLPDLFQLILDLSIDAVGADRGVVMSLEGEELVVRAVRGDAFRISTTVRDKVVLERTSILVRDTKADEMFKNQQSIIGQHIRTMMAVPLQTRERVLGLIHVDSRSFTQEFTPADLELLTVLANIAAIRIEQERLKQIEVAERLMARDLEQAARIQQRLLPQSVPDVPGFDIAGRNVPSRTVGGDYYDFFRYPGGEVAVLLGDVSGKGMPAALLMTSLKGGVQVLAEMHGDPSKLIRALNRVVCANFPANRFVTLFFGALDPATGTLTYCNAGHNPPLLIRADGAVESLRGGGGILGFDADGVFESRTCGLAPGDVVVLYSDGVTETTSPSGEEFGEGRLAEVAREASTLSAAEILKRIDQEVGTFGAGAPPGDDITLLVVRRSA